MYFCKYYTLQLPFCQFRFVKVNKNKKTIYNSVTKTEENPLGFSSVHRKVNVRIGGREKSSLSANDAEFATATQSPANSTPSPLVTANHPHAPKFFS